MTAVELAPAKLYFAPFSAHCGDPGVQLVDVPDDAHPLKLEDYASDPYLRGGEYCVPHYSPEASCEAYGPLALDQVVAFSNLLRKLVAKHSSVVLVTDEADRSRSSNAAVLVGAYLMIIEGWQTPQLIRALGTYSRLTFPCSWTHVKTRPAVLTVTDCWQGLELALRQRWLDRESLQDSAYCAMVCKRYIQLMEQYDVAWLAPSQVLVGADPVTVVSDPDPATCSSLTPDNQVPGATGRRRPSFRGASTPMASVRSLEEDMEPSITGRLAAERQRDAAANPGAAGPGAVGVLGPGQGAGLVLGPGQSGDLDPVLEKSRSIESDSTMAALSRERSLDGREGEDEDEEEEDEYGRESETFNIDDYLASFIKAQEAELQIPVPTALSPEQPQQQKQQQEQQQEQQQQQQQHQQQQQQHHQQSPKEEEGKRPTRSTTEKAKSPDAIIPLYWDSESGRHHSVSKRYETPPATAGPSKSQRESGAVPVATYADDAESVHTVCKEYRPSNWDCQHVKEPPRDDFTTWFKLQNVSTVIRANFANEPGLSHIGGSYNAALFKGHGLLHVDLPTVDKAGGIPDRHTLRAALEAGRGTALEAAGLEEEGLSSQRSRRSRRASGGVAWLKELLMGSSSSSASASRGGRAGSDRAGEASRGESEATCPPAPTLPRGDLAPAIFVHCKGGFGRSVVIASCLLIAKHDIPGRALLGWIRLARPGAITTPQQENFLISLKGSDDLWNYLDEVKSTGCFF